VRALYRKEFHVKQDDDFAMHNSTLPEIARAYNEGEGDGPDSDDLHIDMIGGVNSKWNKEVLHILLAKLKHTRKVEKWALPKRSDSYFAELLKDRYKRAVNVWQRSQRGTNGSGELETWDEVEQRLVAQKEVQLLVNRHTTRRRNVSRWPYWKSTIVNLFSEVLSAYTNSTEHDRAQSRG
jgi:hypothetical protein